MGLLQRTAASCCINFRFSQEDRGHDTSLAQRERISAPGTYQNLSRGLGVQAWQTHGGLTLQGRGATACLVVFGEALQSGASRPSALKFGATLQACSGSS